MWAEFFPNATVVGVGADASALRAAWPDISRRLGAAAARRVHLLVGNHTWPSVLEPLEQLRPFDLVA